MHSFLKQRKKSFLFPVILGSIITFIVFYADYLRFALVEKFLLFAAFIIAPLIIILLNHDEKNKQQQMLFSTIKLLHFPAAILTFVSVMSNKTWGLEDTVLSGGLSLGWLLFTFLLGIYGVSMMITQKGKVSEIAVGAGLVYLFIGGAWFTLYQYQVDLFEANPATHALSSLHFHFSSAIVPIFIGMLGRIMAKKNWYPWVVAIDIIGPILIAIGMIFSKPVEYVGVTLFACNIVIYTTYLLTYLKRNPLHQKAAVFLVLSCLAFYTVVVISLFYPLLKRVYSLTILDFIPIYGVLHAFGFVLCGLIGWVYMVGGVKQRG